MFRKVFSLAVFATLSAAAFAQSAPSIHSNRPRIYADSTRIDWIRANNSAGDCGTTYNEFVYRYDNWWITDPQLYQVGTDSSLWTWTWNSQWAEYQAMFTVSLWKLNLDPVQKKRCYWVLNRVLERLDTATYSTMAWYAKEELIRTMSDVGCLMLDWMYDSLEINKRQHLARTLYTMQREFMNTFILSASGNSYVSSHNAWNNVFANQNCLALWNADGLTSQQNDTILQWHQAVYDKWENGFLPCYGYYRDDDGGWNWGAAYSMWSLIDQFQMFDNMLIGTGKNYYIDLPWVENSINQYWHFIQPDLTTIHQGDGITRLSGDRVIYRHAALFNDDRSRWMAQEYSQPQYYNWTPVVWQKLLFKDFTLPVVTKPSPPTNWFSDKVGLSVSRTTWDTTSTLVWFFNSPSKRAAHEHRDNNSFAIYHKEPLLIDAGYYDTYAGSHYLNYYSRTIAHNSICVYDSAENFFWAATPVSNDGGQIYSNALQNYGNIFEAQNQRGKWKLWGGGTNYCYNIADAALSYDSTKLKKFERRLFFYKPSKVLVLDHLILNNTATQQREPAFLLHFMNQPVISGSIVNTGIVNHIETYNGTDYYMANGGGNVSIRTLLPANSNATKIGGVGYEYYVDGQNYPPQSTPDLSLQTPGAWRIEVKPTVAVQDSLVFFHTISIGETAAPSTAGGTLFSSATTLAAHWSDTVFCFSAIGDTGISMHEVNALPNGNYHFVAADLKPNVPYVVYVASVQITMLSTDSNGVIEFDITVPGGSTVTIVEDLQSVTMADENYNDFVTAFPNPAAGEVNLALSILAKGEAHFIVRDSEGRQVLNGVLNPGASKKIIFPSTGSYTVLTIGKGWSEVERLIVVGGK